LENYQRARALNEELGNGERLIGNLNNMGTIHQVQGDRARAMEYFQKAAELSEELGLKSALAENMVNVGSIHTEQGDLARALECLRRSEAIQEEIGDKRGLAMSLNSIGLVHTKQGDLPLAVNDCQKSRALAEEIGSLDRQKGACECLYEAYKAMGDKGNALLYYEQMVAHRDSMYNEESTKKLTQLEMQYDFDKKEAATAADQEKKDALAAQEMRRKNLQRNAFIGGFGLMLLLAGTFFTQRNRISKARKRSDELLLNILPEEVAEELKATGSAEAVHIDQVTVLFTDFKGFTAMSETLSPQQLVRDLNECFSAFDHITAKYGIEKIKTIGDAYMAAGGLPTPNSTHAMDVINAALEMRNFIAEGKARKIAAGLPYFEIRIGVHTGPVVAGIVGVKKFQYDIWGDTVNTASRMESSGAPGKVNISATTHALLSNADTLRFEPRGLVAAKGKGDLEMFFVERD
jgi:adenylate cyclase